MVDILGQAQGLTGIGGGGGGGVGATTIITFFAIFLIVAIIVGIATFYLINFFQYKYRLRIFKKINGQFQEIKTLKAKAINIRHSGETILKVRKPNKLLPMPYLESGTNTFNYFISEDGEWINFTFGDFDADRREAGSQFLDPEMRYARTSLQSMGEERYASKSWTEYIPVIVNIITILICGIVLWLMADKLIELSSSVANAVDTSSRVMEKANEILGTLDNVGKGGSGLVPAN